MIAVLDACFIIDWSSYRNKHLLEEFFKTMYIHEEVLRQVRSPVAIEYLGRLFTSGVLRLYPWSNTEEKEFNKLRDEVTRDPRIPSLERPDIICLVMAKTLDSVLLSENLGIHRVVQFHPRYRGLRLWTSLELLEKHGL